MKTTKKNKKKKTKTFKLLKGKSIDSIEMGYSEIFALDPIKKNLIEGLCEWKLRVMWKLFQTISRVKLLTHKFL